MERRTITIPEWARAVGCSRGSAYRAAREGKIDGLIRVGKRLMVARSALERLIGERLERLEPGRGGHGDA